MSRLDELIQEFCMDGVEYKPLGTVCGFLSGFAFKSSLFSDEGEPICKTTNIQRSVIDFTGMDCFHPDDYSEDLSKYQVFPNDVVIGMSGTIKVGINSTEGICYLNQRVGKFIPHTDSLTNKYLYYYLCNSIGTLSDGVSGGSVKNLSNKDILEFRIAVPPIEAQREIVRILDNFTELTAELTAELSARKKQYEFYRDTLLDIDLLKTNKTMLVGELFEIKNGLNKEKEAFGKGTPIVNFTDVYNNRYLTADMIKGKVTLSDSEIERFSVKKGDVFFTRTSETKEDVGMSSTIIDDIPYCTFSGFVLRARPLTNLLLPKFCAYYFSSAKVRSIIVRYASLTTRATTTGPKLSKIPVPILPIKEQERIVSILDRFDKHCNDISSGLPAEIEARQKQYEHYRDKLLTFNGEGTDDLS